MVTTQVIGLDGTTIDINAEYIGEIKKEIEQTTSVFIDDLLVFRHDRDCPLDNGEKVIPNITYYYKIYPKIDRVLDKATRQRVYKVRYEEALKHGYISIHQFNKSSTMVLVDANEDVFNPPFRVVENRGRGSESYLDTKTNPPLVYTVVEDSYIRNHIEIIPNNMWASPPLYQVNSTLPSNEEVKNV
jgi:hypothetical protein